LNNVQTIEQIFAGRIMQVPDYQRGYAWDERNWYDFLEDLDLLEPGKQHYTGTLVLHALGADRQRRDEGRRKYEAFHVVDGQQRLTTIVLLLDALRREAQRIGELTLAEGIKENYISVPEYGHGQPLWKLQLNRDTHDFFVNNVLSDRPGPEGPSIRSQERLISAKRHFSRYLTAKEEELGEDYQGWLLDLHDKITSQLKVSLYNVEQSSEVGVIFEVMNNRGKPLSELEKVKNYLLYLSSKLSVGEHGLDEKINDTWTNIFERLMASELVGISNEDQLLRVHWLIAYDYQRKNWEGSKSVKERFGLKRYKGRHKELLNDLHEYTRSLNSASLAYCDVANPHRGDAFSALRSEPVLRDRIIAASDKLRRVRAVATFMPLLVAARLRYPEDGAKYLEMVRTCEVFAFRVYRLRAMRANTGDSTLLRLANQLYSEQRSFEQIMDDLRGTLLYYCSDHHFEEAFKLEAERDWYRWGGLKYFLHEYEQHLAGRKAVQLPWDALEGMRLENTMEHILPQTPTDEYWTSRFDEEERRVLTHDLGNLCLTYNNSVYGNKPFPAKRGHPGQDSPCYANSDLFQERKLSGLDDWNVDELKKRRDEMVEWALNRWHVDQTEPTPPDPEEVEAEEQVLATTTPQYDRA
jgi:hypothetical protein